jgi:prevent-host-death family protein
MPTVTALEAKTRFGELLARVSRGEEIVITRHDKPVARLVPEGRPALAGVRLAVEDLRLLRREIAHQGARPLTAREIKSAIEEGRR